MNIATDVPDDTMLPLRKQFRLNVNSLLEYDRGEWKTHRSINASNCNRLGVSRYHRFFGPRGRGKRSLNARYLSRAFLEIHSSK